MKTSNIVIIILTALCLALTLVVLIRPPCKDSEIRADGSTASWIETQNDSLIKSNASLDKQIRNYKFQTDTLRQKLLATKQTINKLKQQQHEKISRIDSLNSIELYGFFSKFNP